MSLRTPLAHARGLGSAKEGSHHWWHQRLTAIAHAPLTLWFVGSLICLGSADHQTVVEWIKDPISTVLLISYLTIMYYHAALGLQVVIEDYIDIEYLKITALILVKFAFLFAGVVSVFAVLKVSLGI